MEKENNYCRLCMCEDDLSEMKDSVLHIIRNEFSLHIHENDELSRDICSKCSTFLPKLKLFKEKVFKTQNLLQKILKRKDRVVVNVDEGNSNNKTDHNNKREEYKTTDRYTTRTEPDVIQDLTKSDVIASKDDLITKIIKSIDLEEIEKKMKKTTITWHPGKSFCEVCKIKILDREKYQKHMRSSAHHFKHYIISKSGNAKIFEEHLIGYTCQVCREVFTSKTVMCNHSKDVHKVPMNKNLVKPDTIIPKSIVKSDDRKETDLEKVKIKEEPGTSNINEKKHPCNLCSKSFGFAESKFNHMKKHHRTFFCIRCGFTTINKQKYATHLRSHYNLKHPQRICTQCFKVCQNYRDFALHRKEVHEAAILICPICQMKFSNSTLFKKHKRDVHRTKHSEVSRFLCRRCNRSFLSSLVLEKHQCVALKYPCLKKCGKRFEFYSEMNRHSKICLSGLTIFNCKNCNKRLKCLQTLKKHMITCEKIPSPSNAGSTNTTLNSNVEKLKNSNEENIESAVASSSKSSIENYLKPFTQQVRMKPKTDDDFSKNVISLFENGFQRPTHQMITKPKTFMRSSSESLISSIEDQPSKHQMKTKPETSENEISSIEKTISKKWKKKTKNKKKLSSECDIKLKSEMKQRAKISATPATSSRKGASTISCRTCGLVFKDEVFLKKHQSFCYVPSLLGETGNKTVGLPLMVEIPSANLPTSSGVNEKHRLSHESGSRSMSSEDFSRQKTLSSTPTMSTRTEKSHNFEDQLPTSRLINPNRATLPKPEYLISTSTSKKPPEQLTIIQNSGLNCYICKNPQPHLFCRPCARCFVKNQVQYLNHMKMKHSGA